MHLSATDRRINIYRVIQKVNHQDLVIISSNKNFTDTLSTKFAIKQIAGDLVGLIP